LVVLSLLRAIEALHNKQSGSIGEWDACSRICIPTIPQLNFDGRQFPIADELRDDTARSNRQIAVVLGSAITRSRTRAKILKGLGKFPNCVQRKGAGTNPASRPKIAALDLGREADQAVSSAAKAVTDQKSAEMVSANANAARRLNPSEGTGHPGAFKPGQP